MNQHDTSWWRRASPTCDWPAALLVLESVAGVMTRWICCAVSCCVIYCVFRHKSVHFVYLVNFFLEFLKMTASKEYNSDLDYYFNKVYNREKGTVFGRDGKSWGMCLCFDFRFCYLFGDKARTTVFIYYQHTITIYLQQLLKNDLLHFITWGRGVVYIPTYHLNLPHSSAHYSLNLSRIYQNYQNTTKFPTFKYYTWTLSHFVATYIDSFVMQDDQ